MANILNPRGKTYAMQLVATGKVDRTSSWSFDSADARRELGNPPNWNHFDRIHLGVDTTAGLQTMGRFKYPFAKNGKVYRRGIVAAKSRAAQQGDSAIASAADAVLRRIDASTQTNSVVPDCVFYAR